MTNISDVVNVADMEAEIAAGYINRRFHPDYPELAIVSYSDSAQYDHHWTDTVMALRGLIYNTTTGDVVARPFRKFFNFDQNEAPSIAWDQLLYHWANKEDGSLGIVYPTPNGTLAVATRGSFDSEQARHANALLPHTYAHRWEQLVADGYTPLVEIVYPENRIVLNYGDRDELIFLGMVNIADGAYYPDHASQPERRKFSELQGDLSRPNAEGWVAWLNPWKAVKIKQADYLALHRIISNLTVKEVWRQLRDGTFHDFVIALPDEFQPWARDIADPMVLQHSQITQLAIMDYQRVLGGDDEREVSRKAFALEAKKSPNARYLFALLDGKDINPIIWRAIEPNGNDTKELVP